MKSIKYLIIVSVTLGFSSCKNESPKSEIKAPIQDHVTLTQKQLGFSEVKFEPAVEKEISQPIEVRGLIATPPQNTYMIHLPYGGYVRFGELLPGTPVKKGQVICWVKNPRFITLQQSYLEAKIKVTQLELEYKRQLSLTEDKINPKKNLELITADLEMQKVALASSQNQLELLGLNTQNFTSSKLKNEIEIRAPFNGFVQELTAVNGAYISEQQSVMILNKLDDLHVELNVFEKDLPFVKPGQIIDFKLVKDHHFKDFRKGKVELISSVIGKDGVAKVHATIMGSGQDLRPGMYIDARIYCDPMKSWVIPESCVVRYKGGTYAFYTEDLEISQECSFHLKEIQTGRVFDGWVEIIFENKDAQKNQVRWVSQGARSLMGVLKNEATE